LLPDGITLPNMAESHPLQGVALGNEEEWAKKNRDEVSVFWGA